MLPGAALCPATPLLHPALTGQDPVVPELRRACAHAVTRLLTAGPDTVVVIGPAGATSEWDPAGRLDPSVFAPGIVAAGERSLPPPLGLGSPTNGVGVGGAWITSSAAGVVLKEGEKSGPRARAAVPVA